MSNHHHVVIVGGGAAGISVAARLLRELPEADVAIVDPSPQHYYQPLWTLVGGGIFPREASRRNQADVMPRGATWITEAVESFAPDQNSIRTNNGTLIDYEFLVVCPGLALRWDKVAGLQETLGKNNVCSNYSYETVAYTWETIRNFSGGTALFTHPLGAVKCGGAPQKICYLAEDHFRRTGIRDDCELILTIAKNKIFDSPLYAATIERAAARKKIDVRLELDLKEIRGEEKQAVLQRVGSDEMVMIDFDMAHVTPPMGPPACVASSPLADDGGWVDVDSQTLQHVRFDNIFGLGDASNLPTSKTAAAIRKQAPVLVENLLAIVDGNAPTARYDGYTSCPVVTGYDSLILAEFDYDKVPCETFPFEQSEERFSMMMLKKHLLPALYWHGMLKGRV